MAKQNRLKTVTGGPQGDDASVVILKPTHGEMRKFTRATATLSAKIKDNPENVEVQDALTELGNDLITASVVAWNWADDEGNEWDPPRVDSAVLDAMTDDERNWLTVVIIGGDPAELEKKAG
jgi:hypothetical protein